MLFLKGLPILFSEITYDTFDRTSSSGKYSGISNQAESGLVGLFRIGLNIGVYVGAAGLIVAFIAMMWFATSPKQVAEVKSRAIRICIILILIFGVASIVSLIIKAKL